jgi:heme oxygenase
MDSAPRKTLAAAFWTLAAASGLATGCGSGGDRTGARLSATDFASSTATPTSPLPTAASAPRNPPTPKPERTTPVAALTPTPPAAVVPQVPDAKPEEVVATIGTPPTLINAVPMGDAVLVDSKIGDVNNRALYASGFLEPMEAALRAKAVELKKAAKGDERAVRDAWEQYAIEQIGTRLVSFIRDEIFRAEGLASLKPEQREGLSAYIGRLRDEEIRRNQGSLTMTDEEIARRTGGKSLDEYMRTREQTELIRFQLFQQIDRKIQVAWRDIKQQYESNRDKYNPDPTAYLRMIIVSARDEAGIKEISDALASGKDFAEVAENEVNLFNRDKGGLTSAVFEGPLAEATLTNFKPVNAVAVTLAPGTHAGPVDNGTTRAWVKLERIEQVTVSLYDAQLGIENELFAERQNRAIEQYMRKLQQRASLSDLEEMGQRVLQFARERCLEPVLRSATADARN